MACFGYHLDMEKPLNSIFPGNWNPIQQYIGWRKLIRSSSETGNWLSFDSGVNLNHKKKKRGLRAYVAASNNFRPKTWCRLHSVNLRLDVFAMKCVQKTKNLIKLVKLFARNGERLRFMAAEQTPGHASKIGST